MPGSPAKSLTPTAAVQERCTHARRHDAVAPGSRHRPRPRLERVPRAAARPGDSARWSLPGGVRLDTGGRAAAACQLLPCVPHRRRGQTSAPRPGSHWLAESYEQAPRYDSTTGVIA